MFDGLIANMPRNIFIFLPDILERRFVGYLDGLHKKTDDTESYYIISPSVTKYSSDAICYVGKNSKHVKKLENIKLFLNIANGKINIVDDNVSDNYVVEISYNYSSFNNSSVVYSECEKYGKHFGFLTYKLRQRNENGSRNGLFGAILQKLILVIDIFLLVLGKLKICLSYSETYTYFVDRVTRLKWILITVQKERRVSPTVGNVLVASFLDVLIGMVLSYWLLRYEQDVVQFLQSTLEDIISNLKSLLVYLMGSPIGLKLNHSLNKALGQFFFYHISLWKLFLQGINPVFVSYFRYLVLPGVFGVSFQIAMFSDVVSVATFHIFCIYVYAARLFNLQLKGLISLWRLFIGRKYNPLRNRVDSCQYSPEQLFIGTLGFTVLVFLLPTTLMYYTVFSVFRLVINIVAKLLIKARYLSNTIPLYVVVLWILRSPSVAGTLYMEWVSCDEHGRTKIHATLNLLPLSESIGRFVPEASTSTKSVSLSHLLHCALTGTML